MAFSTVRYKTDPKLDLAMVREIDIPPSAVWKAWTTPEALKVWFCPAPWKTVECEIDLRPGGIFRTTMRSPEGVDHPSTGCYLEVVPNEKLVFTDILKPGFRPSAEGFFTAMIMLVSNGKGGTKYTAIAMHKDEEARRKHEEMGFEKGWSTALDQLVAFVKSNPTR